MATTDFTVFSQVFQCPAVPEEGSALRLREGGIQDCQGQAYKGERVSSLLCQGTLRGDSVTEPKFGSVPVLVSYLCGNNCKPQLGQRLHNDTNPKKREFFEKYDLGKIQGD